MKRYNDNEKPTILEAVIRDTERIVAHSIVDVLTGAEVKVFDSVSLDGGVTLDEVEELLELKP